jgi:glyoxylase-like metal-dependent hydrolase (beta-lactamase superfamily II)
LDLFSSFIFLTVMQLNSILCGELKVAATDMVKPLSKKEIAKAYPLEKDGSMKLAMRALLVEKEDRKVLVDPGTADFLPRKLQEEYGLELNPSFENDLIRLGVEPGQVTDVVFTHLHFDHASGAFKRIPGDIVKRFPNARYHLLKEHYIYALDPDPEEADSFATGLLKYLDRIYWLEDWDLDWIDFQIYNGHTRGMVVPVIKGGKGPVYFASDLLPMEMFLNPDLWCGYDLEPELLLQEKKDFLEGIPSDSTIFFFHDILKDSVLY